MAPRRATAAPLSPGAIERFRRGDPAAFELVFDVTAPAAHALARGICRNPAVMEDALQNAYVDVWRSASGYDPAMGSVATWVLRIVRNRSIDALRRAGVHERRRAGDAVHLELVAEGPGLLDQVLLTEGARDVRAALGVLAPVQRRVLELAFVGGLSQTEIADRLGVPLGTVKSRTRRALSLLRGTMELHGTLEPDPLPAVLAPVVSAA